MSALKQCFSYPCWFQLRLVTSHAVARAVTKWDKRALHYVQRFPAHFQNPMSFPASVFSSFVVRSKIAHPGQGIDFVHAKGPRVAPLAQRSELQAHYDLIDALQGRRRPLGPVVLMDR